MLTPELIAIFGLIISSAIFYFYAKNINKEKLTLDGFVLSDSALKENQFGNTFAASSISLATFIMFFFFGSKIYGLFLLVSPFSYLLGQYLFVRLIKNSDVDFRDCRTLSDFCYKFFPSKKIARLITYMTLMSYIMLVFIELYIGSIVFSIFLPDNIIYQTLSFLGMGVLILMYVKLGGYKALIKTDILQLTLMLLATFLIFIYGIIAPIVNNNSTSMVLLNTLHYTGQNWFLLWFIIWLTVLNLVTPFTQLPLWQRIAASKSKETSLKGVLHSSWKVIALCAFPILGFILLNAKGYTFESFPAFLQTIKQTGWFSGYILFPLLIVGLCSTVFSSADTAIIAIIYALSDKNTFLERFSNMSEIHLRRALTVIISSMLVILTVIYWIQFTGLQDWLIPIIYAFCGLLPILSPLPIYILIQLAKGKTVQQVRVTKKNSFFLFNGIILAWAILLFNTYLAKITDFQLWSQLSVPTGMSIIGCVAWRIYISNKKGQCLELYNEGKSASQIGEILGIPIGTVEAIFDKQNS